MQTKPKNAACLFANLVKVVPEFRDRYEEHLHDNEELLPYPAMDAFARFLIEHFMRYVNSNGTDTKSLDVFRRGVAFLEDARKKDEDMNTFIRSTFVDTVQTYWSDKTIFEKLLIELGPGLRNEIVDGLCR